MKKKKTGINRAANYGTTILAWNAPEYQEHNRDEKWLMVAGVIALILITWAIWDGTYSFAIVVVLVAGIYFLTQHHTPNEIDISLTTSGILANQQFFPFTNIQAFWVIYNPDTNVKTLSFSMKTGLIREMNLQLETQDPAEVRSFLGSHVFELEGRTETFVEKTIRVLKL